MNVNKMLTVKNSYEVTQKIIMPFRVCGNRLRLCHLVCIIPLALSDHLSNE